MSGAERVARLLRWPWEFKGGVWRMAIRRSWRGPEKVFTFPTYTQLAAAVKNYSDSLRWDWWHEPATIDDPEWSRLADFLQQHPRAYVFARVFKLGRQRRIILGWHEDLGADGEEVAHEHATRAVGARA